MLPRLIDVVFLVGFALSWPVWRGKKRGDWAARWGRGEPLPAAPEGGRLLLHAVSVGEVNATKPLVRRLLADGRFAASDVALSVTTDTGRARAASLYAAEIESGRMHVVRYPLDASFAVRRFFDRVRPTAIALMELELWPNFILEAERRGVGVCVLNGRLSERSFPRYRRMRWLLGRFFAKLRFAAVQDETYADRFRRVGVREVTVTGSMKWDGAADAVREDEPALSEAAGRLAAELGVDRSKLLVVGGSTAPGEPELLVEALRSCAPGDDVQLLVAPRKPEWFDAAAAALATDGGSPVRRSQPGSGDAASGRFVLDTIGELRAAYLLADVVVVGRSFGELYGSDVMEPAALGKPVLIGPRYSDFVEAVDALRKAGGLRVVERGGVADALVELLGDETARVRMAEAAQRCVKSKCGAADRSLALLAGMMRLDRGPDGGDREQAAEGTDREVAGVSPAPGGRS